jgi:hypothetical protein
VSKSDPQLDENLVIGVKQAIKGHFMLETEMAATLTQIHDLWNAWPALPLPIEITKAAIEALQIEHFLEQVEQAGKARWRKAREYG